MTSSVITHYDEVAFREVCAKGLLDVAQELLTRNPNIPTSASFRGACIHGHLEVARWLLDLNPSLDLVAETNFLFPIVCTNAKAGLEVVQWMVELNPSLLKKCDSVVQDACCKGRLDTVQYLLEKNPLIKVEKAFHPKIFKKVCKNGHLEVAQFMMQRNPSHLNVCADTEYTVRNIDNFHFEQICSEIKDAFYGACFNGHLEVAQWLMQVQPTLVKCCTEELLLNLCTLSLFSVAKWMLEEGNPALKSDPCTTYAFRNAVYQSSSIAKVEKNQWFELVTN